MASNLPSRKEKIREQNHSDIFFTSPKNGDEQKTKVS